MAEIRVTTPSGEYAILIENGLLQSLPLPDDLLARSSAVISNTTVAPLHGQLLTDAPVSGVLAPMQDGETYKNMDTVIKLYGDLIDAGMDRSSVVYGLGGGVVGDVAGFVAATFMRGVRFVQVPTSLLAMVDSSVGGKVGVDLPQGKNLVGAFKQPEYVLIDPDVLKTLPDVEWRNGMAEVIKHGFLSDESLLDPALHAREEAADLVTRAVQVKVNVVERDPFEKGERAYLNLGHTFGHAIEQATGYAIPHGQGVAIGIMAAAHLSYVLKQCDAGLVDQTAAVLDSVGLPRNLGEVDLEAIWQAMRTDKKWRDGINRFVLLRGMGQPFIMEDVKKELVIAALQAVQ